MKVIETSLEGVIIIEPDVFKDQRGAFLETYQQKRYREVGIPAVFVQDNVSFSTRGTLRGLHYQFPHAQAKLVQVLSGEVFDVAVDIRVGSKTFGQWTGALLSDANHCQLFIPEGFAHGFCVLSETAVFTYKCSEFYHPASEGGIIWSDKDLKIGWPVDSPLISVKDEKYPFLKDIPEERLPVF